MSKYPSRLLVITLALVCSTTVYGFCDTCPCHDALTENSAYSQCAHVEEPVADCQCPLSDHQGAADELLAESIG